MTHELHFNLEPTAKGRPRFTRKGIAFTPNETRLAEKQLKLYMAALWRKPPLTGPLRVEMVFTVQKPKRCKREYPSVRPDVDNFCKLLMDSGNEIIWSDDALIVDLSVRKEYGTPGIQLRVGEL